MKYTDGSQQDAWLGNKKNADFADGGVRFAGKGAKVTYNNTL